MSKVKVYRAGTYDISIDGYRRSRRWMTRQGAALAGLTIEETTEIEIDPRALIPSEQWTDLDYNPQGNGGFQKQVF